jgi:hypothetical protein
VPKVVLLLILVLGMSGCNLLKSTLELPEKGIRSMLLLDQENEAAKRLSIFSLFSADFPVKELKRMHLKQ